VVDPCPNCGIIEAEGLGRSVIPKVFICYRRDDAGPIAGRLYDALAPTFDHDNIFMDVEGVPPGIDFVEHIKDKVSVCDIFLAIVGPNWLNARDETGNRRLESPDVL
jgi:hypothetical protein